MYTGLKSVTLSGQSIIENVQVVQMYAQKSENGNMNMNINVINKNIYDANKAECEADIEAFRAEVEEL
jgi:hypothetical protein